MFRVRCCLFFIRILSVFALDSVRLSVCMCVVDQAPAGDPLFTVALPALVTGSMCLLNLFAYLLTFCFIITYSSRCCDVTLFVTVFFFFRLVRFLCAPASCRRDHVL